MRTPLLLLLLLLLVSPAFADVPSFDGFVTDRAGLLDGAQKRTLESLMESYRQGTSHEIAILIVKSLEGRPIEEFALQVARTWKIGGKGSNNGALIVVAVEDRKLRIEVGDGLEGSLTDSICGRIIRDVIAPHFKAGHPYEGLLAGVRATHEVVGGNYGMLKRSRRSHRSVGQSLASLLFLAVIFFFVFARRRHYGGGGLGRGLLGGLFVASMLSGSRHRGGFGGFGGGGGGFGGFGGGGGFSGGGASGGW